MISHDSSSAFERLTGKPAKPVWVLRGFVLAALLCLALALLVFKAGGAHDFCLGLAFGVLLATAVQLFSVTSVEVNTPVRSDVDTLHVAR